MEIWYQEAAASLNNLPSNLLFCKGKAGQELWYDPNGSLLSDQTWLCGIWDTNCSQWSQEPTLEQGDPVHGPSWSWLLLPGDLWWGEKLIELWISLTVSMSLFDLMFVYVSEFHVCFAPFLMRCSEGVLHGRQDSLDSCYHPRESEGGHGGRRVVQPQWSAGWWQGGHDQPGHVLCCEYSYTFYSSTPQWWI